MNAAAYDSYLPGFEKSIPALVKAWDDTPVEKLAEQIKMLAGLGFAVGRGFGGHVAGGVLWRGDTAQACAIGGADAGSAGCGIGQS